MTYLPGFDYALGQFDWTRAELITYLTAYYVTIAIYCSLVLLALLNIWMIIVKQKEYKNLPILMFYAFALVSVILRPIMIVWWWTPHPVFANIDFVQ